MNKKTLNLNYACMCNSRKRQNTIGREQLSFFCLFYYAQAVLFLCMTSNLNLLCKDGYIFFSLLCPKPGSKTLVCDLR